MTDKYLVKADYECPTVATGGKWITVKCENKPQIGSFSTGPLPPSGCKRYYESQLCEEDPKCSWQRILAVKPYSESEAKRLKANQLESCLENA